jgi:two-component system, OmpR family, alkaline phosphatase synthesis response regulator PhoP
MARIVIVGEATELNEFLGHALVQEGYRVRFVHDIRPSVSKVTRTLPNLVIVDGSHSFSIAEQFCIQLRGRYALDECRVLLFADALRPTNGTSVFALGADAYLERPLHPRAVIDCVRQLLNGANSSYTRNSLVVGDLVIEPSSFRITRSGKMATLTLGEFRLLYHLASHPNQVFRREELLNLIAVNPRSTARTVDVFIRYLREKVEENPHQPDLICTVQGHGYMFRIPEQRVENTAVLSPKRGSHETIDHRQQLPGIVRRGALANPIRVLK